METEIIQGHIERFKAMFAGPPVDLHPELKRYMWDEPWPMVKHPMVFSVFGYTPMHNALLNYQLEEKKARYAEALEKGEWGTCVFLYERPYRARALYKLADKIPHEKYWELVGDVWTDSENTWQELPLWRKLFSAKRPEKNLLMTGEELAHFNALPETLKIYRGIQRMSAAKGFAWTLSKKKAIWFANRYSQRNGIILSGEVEKRHAIALFEGRGESEIVVFPRYIKDIKKAPA